MNKNIANKLQHKQPQLLHSMIALQYTDKPRSIVLDKLHSEKVIEPRLTKPQWQKSDDL